MVRSFQISEISVAGRAQPSQKPDRTLVNPRKTFDPDALAELAESIAAAGLLQNIVVRPGPDDTHIIMAGERRWRAIGLLRAAGRWDKPVLSNIVQASEAQHLAIALLENLQRQDVAPLEEADGFQQLQQLDPKIYTAKAIAEKIGRTPRYVYMRLALATKLAPEARIALKTGKINIEGARLLTTATPEIQADILKRQADDATGKVNADEIQWELSGSLMSVETAIFDVAASGLEILDLENAQFFSDRKRAIEAQLQAVKLKAKELRKLWHFVKVMEPGAWFNSNDWLTKRKKSEGGGCIITIARPSYQVTILEGMLKKPEQKAKLLDTAAIEAQRKAAQEKREADHNAKLSAFDNVTKKLDTDWAGPPEVDGEKTCDDGCKFRVLLAFPAPNEYHVCLSQTSPRSGLLTREDQGGHGCFEVA